MKKYLWLLILLTPFLIAASVQQKHMMVIGRKNVAAASCPAGAPTYFGYGHSPADDGAQQTGTRTVTPPGSMVAGDLAVLVGYSRYASTECMSVSEAGGQTWNVVIAGTNLPPGAGWTEIWWAEYDGTWDATPSLYTSCGTTNAFTVAMIVFRPNDASCTWAIDVAATTSSEGWSSFPYKTDLDSITTNSDNAIAVFVLVQGDDNTLYEWDDASGNGFSEPTPDQVRNNTTTDNVLGITYKVTTTAGATGECNVRSEGNDAAGSARFAFTEN